MFHKLLNQIFDVQSWERGHKRKVNGPTKTLEVCYHPVAGARGHHYPNLSQTPLLFEAFRSLFRFWAGCDGFFQMIPEIIGDLSASVK